MILTSNIYDNDNLLLKYFTSLYPYDLKESGDFDLYYNIHKSDFSKCYIELLSLYLDKTENNVLFNKGIDFTEIDCNIMPKDSKTEHCFDKRRKYVDIISVSEKSLSEIWSGPENDHWDEFLRNC